MFDYIDKFNKLPKAIRDKISPTGPMANINALENKYKVNLVPVVMRIMIKEIDLKKLPIFLASEFNLEKKQASKLAGDIRDNILSAVADYLGLALREREEQNREKEANIKLKLTKEPAVDLKQENKPDSGKKSSADFFFSSEDEEEIKEVAEKINGYGDNFNNRIEEQLSNIIAKVEINFGSEDLTNRFREIIKIYLRGVRDKVDTKQTLMKTFMAGGLGFDQESANTVMEVVDQQKNGQINTKIKAPAKIKLPEDLVDKRDKEAKFLGRRDADYDLVKALEKKKQDREEKTKTQLSPQPESGIIKIKPTKKSEELDLISSSQLEIKEPVDPASAYNHQPRPANYDKNASGKIKMSDVKHVPKIMGPIDELKYLDLANWRRLSPDKNKIKDKILKKIKLLEEEGYDKRIAGVKAWRQSPVNKLYLVMGQESINENKPIDIIIQERKAAGKEVLDNEEFNTVLDLNKDLKF